MNPAKNNDELVELVRNNEFYLKFKSPRDEGVLEAMRRVDRMDFLSSELLALLTIDYDAFKKLYKARMNMQGARGNKNLNNLLDAIDKAIISIEEFDVEIRHLAYNDKPLPIHKGLNCSQPSIVGFMADVLELRKGMKVLEIGSGSGYSAAIVSRLLGKHGHLVTVEYLPPVAKTAKINLANHFGKRELERRLKVVSTDGSAGYKQEAPYDRIYLTAGVKLKSFKPSVLAEQLKPHGILLFPEVQGDLIRQNYREHQLVQETKYENVRFVPLKGKNS